MVRVTLPTACVVPNVEGRYKRMRALSIAGLCVAIAAFVGTILCIILFVAADISSIQYMSIPMPFIVFGMMIFIFANVKSMQYARVKSVVNTVKTREKVLLIDIFPFEANALELAQALIDTGNLAEFELVAGVLLAKKELHVSEEEAVAMHNERMNGAGGMMGAMMGVPPVYPAAQDDMTPTKTAEPKPRFCTQCGAKLSSTDKFCPSCGTKLDNTL